MNIEGAKHESPIKYILSVQYTRDPNSLERWSRENRHCPEVSNEYS